MIDGGGQGSLMACGLAGGHQVAEAGPAAVDGGEHPDAVVEIAIVCSPCAAPEPSRVTTVQPSSSSSVRGDARVIIGSIASAMPGRQPRPLARAGRS